MNGVVVTENAVKKTHEANCTPSQTTSSPTLQYMINEASTHACFLFCRTSLNIMHRDPQTPELWTQLPYGLRHVDKSRCAAKVLSCLHFHFSVLHSMHPPADVWTVVMWSTLQIRILGSHKHMKDIILLCRVAPSITLNETVTVNMAPLKRGGGGGCSKTGEVAAYGSGASQCTQLRP